MSIIEFLLAQIAPHECLQCTAEGSLLCAACQAAIPRQLAGCYRCGRATDDAQTCRQCRKASPLYAVFRAAPYEGVCKEMVYGMKFERKRAAAQPIAAMMASVLPTLSKEYYMTHIPTAHSRVRVRGYDQAEQIARALAGMVQVPHAALLSRQGNQRQVGQSRSVRLRQLEHAFCSTRSEDIAGKHIMLVDDVITTGASLEAAARVMKAAGAKRVSAVVFAAA